MAQEKVVYLFGAGASHGCVSLFRSPYGLLMRDIRTELNLATQAIVNKKYRNSASIIGIANTIAEDADVEHVVTFLDDSSSGVHREFAADLRRIFEQALRKQLAAVQEDIGKEPVDLYAALFDMYHVTRLEESLAGLLTTNYDSYIETALQQAGFEPPDFGFQLAQAEPPGSLHLLKLHGSLDWKATWPPTRTQRAKPALWIPPGIQKAKDRYPFSVLWGKARELLDCDVLRIVGFRLDANDWDLVSLLFGTMHGADNYRPYRLEIIDSLQQADAIKNAFPYLDARSITELDLVGPRFIAEHTDGTDREWTELSEAQQEAVREKACAIDNWFATWLKLKLETLQDQVGSVTTPSRLAETFLENDL